ncbi:hypothetical protein [Roseicitreum antarcticum]|uniref:Uncharacterized protein n=1 Tax=Roseicitreum antarcticum TaxID=564137 RepID=A0A1H2XGB0_9RHOB|nr:hypothetical protein [Roseicitreum antarcticum]SDW91758.1 hypothetical protein SAMN04488238_104180 [Roseicitreum antarcticum]
MTDPVSNKNIEDVLSSIRRLVSQETLNTGGGKAAAGPARPASDAPALRHTGVGQAAAAVDKLVLTPAQRVVDPDPRDAPGQRPALTDHAALAPAGRDDLTLDATVTSAYASDATDKNRYAPDAGRADALTAGTAPENAAPKPAHAVPNTRVGAIPALHPAAGIVAQQNIDKAAPHFVIPSVNTPATTLESTIAALEAAISSSAEHWEIDGTDEVPAQAANNVTALHRHPGTDRKTALPRTPDVETPVKAAPTPDQVQGGGTSVAPLRLTSADAVPQPEPRAAHSIVEQPLATLPAREKPVPDSTTDDRTDSTDQLSDDALIDEDTLHDMVVEIVRAELQGQLGERITRNIRKLVRTEVARALAEKQYL